MAVLIAQEAANMQYSITSALHEHTKPRQGKHDDLLLSVAMTWFYGLHDRPPPQAEPPIILLGQSRWLEDDDY